MPLVQVNILPNAKASPEPVGEVSYETNCSFLDLRARIDKMRLCQGSYSFWSMRMGCKILPCLESENLVKDHGEVTILGTPQQSLVSSPDLGSQTELVVQRHRSCVVTSPTRTAVRESRQEPDDNFCMVGGDDFNYLGEDITPSVGGRGQASLVGSPLDRHERLASGVGASFDTGKDNDGDIDATILSSGLSSHASNAPSNAPFSPEELKLIREAPWFPVPKSKAGSEGRDCEVEAISDFACKHHGSQAMSSDIMKEWNSGIQKLKTFYAELEVPDQRWMSVTWDEPSDGSAGSKTPQAALVCLECRSVSIASLKGESASGDKIAVQNCQNNWRLKHLKSGKHNGFVKRKRASKETDEAVLPEAKRKKDMEPDDRSTVESAHDSMKAVNLIAGGDRPTYIFRGNVEDIPCLASRFSIQCSYCGNVFAINPRGNNLKHNLLQHAKAQDHLKRVARTQSALRTGKPGRPEKVDSRDTKQTGISKYFFKTPVGFGRSGSDVGSTAGSTVSSGNAVPGNSQGNSTWDFDDLCLNFEPLLSSLCWGYRFDTYKDNHVKPLLQDRHLGVEWRAEPYTSGIIGDFATRELNPFEGTFRHLKCSRVSVNASSGGRFKDLICEHCFSIPLQSDFRNRVNREALSEVPRGSRDTGNGRRLQYLQGVELEGLSSDLIAQNRRLLKTTDRLAGTIAKLKAKSPDLKSVLGSAVAQKDVLKFCRSIYAAHSTGAFGGKPALWGLLKDIVFNLNKEEQGHRFCRETKSIMQALFQHGGRRVVECLYANLGAPSYNTLMRGRRGMVDFCCGVNAAQFEFIASVYKDRKERAGITGDIPVILAEDETAVKPSVRWLQKHDILVGFCGPSENHTCNPGLEVVVGDRTEAFANIENAFLHNRKGCHARVIVVNPLVEGFPKLCLVASATCNCFKADFVKDQWAEVRAMWNIHCRDAVGPIIGHASDGDSRRRKVMLQSWTGSGQPCDQRTKRKPALWEGWSMSYDLVFSNENHLSDPYGLHDQDYVHNGKKGVGPVDSATRVLRFGNSFVSFDHIGMVFRLYPKQHGLTLEDLKRTDRQNWGSAQRLCSKSVLDCLRHMRLRRDENTELCYGTEAYLRVIHDYISIFLDIRLSLRERIVRCARVAFFSDFGDFG